MHGTAGRGPVSAASGPAGAPASKKLTNLPDEKHYVPIILINFVSDGSDGRSLKRTSPSYTPVISLFCRGPSDSFSH